MHTSRPVASGTPGSTSCSGDRPQPRPSRRSSSRPMAPRSSAGSRSATSCSRRCCSRPRHRSCCSRSRSRSCPWCSDREARSASASWSRRYRRSPGASSSRSFCARPPNIRPMTYRPTVRAANGIVASGHHLATVAGLDALRDGGSAADAAIAAAAVCAVVLPHRTAIGGDVFALVYDASTRQVTAYNGSGTAPAALDPSGLSRGFADHGVTLATVPGCVAAWGDILADHGRLGIDRVLAPAIGYAAEGFPVSNVLSAAIAEEADRIAADETASGTYSPRGRHQRPGEMLQQPELADSLRAITNSGDDVLYHGELEQRI